jgi:hypothetical protein
VNTDARYEYQSISLAFCGAGNETFALTQTHFTNEANIGLEINVWEGASYTTCYRGNAKGSGVVGGRLQYPCAANTVGSTIEVKLTTLAAVVPFELKVAEVDFVARPAPDVWQSANLTSLVDGVTAWGSLQHTSQDFSTTTGSCVRVKADSVTGSSEVRVHLDQRYVVWTVRVYGRKDGKDLVGTSAYVADAASGDIGITKKVRCGVNGAYAGESTESMAATLSLYNTTTTIA